MSTKTKILASIVALLLLTPGHPANSSESQHPLFYPKRFHDPGPNGDTIGAEGALLSQAIAYKNNRVSITCYKLMKECWVITIETQGNIIFDILGPVSYAVTHWTKDVVIAKGRNICSEEIWALDRIQNVARLNRVPLFEDQYCKQPALSVTISDPLPENSVYGDRTKQMSQ